MIQTYLENDRSIIEKKIKLTRSVFKHLDSNRMKVQKNAKC